MQEEPNKQSNRKNLGRLTLKMVEEMNKLENKANPHFSNESKTTEEYPKSSNLLKELNINNQIKLNKPINFNFLELSITQIKELTDDELLKLLSGEGHKGAIRDSTIQLISNELLTRQIKRSSKPHWNVYAILVLTFIAAAASVIAVLK